MTDDGDQPQRREVLDGVVEAPDALRAGDVAGDPDDEEVVRRLTEHELGRYPRIRAAQHGGERLVCERSARLARQPEGVRADLDDVSAARVADGGERRVAAVEARPGRGSVPGWASSYPLSGS